MVVEECYIIQNFVKHLNSSLIFITVYPIAGEFLVKSKGLKYSTEKKL